MMTFLSWQNWMQKGRCGDYSFTWFLIIEIANHARRRYAVTYMLPAVYRFLGTRFVK